MNVIKRILRTLLTISTPFVFLMLAVRLMLTPFFLNIEYRMPGFPPDTYGFTKDQRLEWSKVSVDYLTNSEGIEFLADQRLEDGTPLYNERELSHMKDVKDVVTMMTRVWLIVLGVWVLIFITAAFGLWLREALLGVSDGGFVTLGLMVLLIILILLDFNTLFTKFHELFFEGETWIFNYTDHLIRLFPIRFWTDAFIFTGGIAILLSVLAISARKWLRA